MAKPKKPASSQILEQADRFTPQLRNSLTQLGEALAKRERDELVEAARSAPFAREALWMFFLPISRRQREELGRIYSFQCSTNKDGSSGEYRMSLATGAAELSIDRDNLKNDLRELVEMGFLLKRSNGAQRPATYLVDEVACLIAARENGYAG